MSRPSRGQRREAQRAAAEEFFRRRREPPTRYGPAETGGCPPWGGDQSGAGTSKVGVIDLPEPGSVLDVQQSKEILRRLASGELKQKR